MSSTLRLENQKIFSDSKEVMPGGVNSPIRACKGLDRGPLIASRGYQGMIEDADGRAFVDLCLSWGALLHGHAHPEIVAVAKGQIERGSSFGVGTKSEERLARKVTEIAVGVDQVRFVSSGTEAVMTAVRLARGFTERPLIIKFNGGYHGHSDGFLVKGGSGLSSLSFDASSAGVPHEITQQTLSIPYNDTQTFLSLMRHPQIKKRIAAVVIEPIAANMGVVLPRPDFLDSVRKETASAGALLIFDEVITGFRVARGGAAALFGITPDLSCFGKIIGGGFPAAALGGRREIMQHLAPVGKVFQAGTLSGNPVAMEAGFVALELASVEGFYETLRERTKILTEPLKRKIEKKGIQATVQESTGMFTLFFGPTRVDSFEDLKQLDQKQFNAFFSYLWDQGIYISPSPYEALFISPAHQESQLEKVAAHMLSFLDRI